MEKIKFRKAKNLFRSLLMLSAQTGTLVYELLEVGQAATVEGEPAPDGEYTITVDEVEKTVVIVAGLIDSITDVELKDEGEKTVVIPDGEYTIMVDEVETTISIKDGVLVVPEIEMTDEEKEAEKLKLATVEKEKILNIPNLLAAFSDKKNGSGSIPFEFKDGILQWGDMFTSEYKTLLSSDIDEKDKLIKDLKLSIEKKGTTILALTEEKAELLIQAPIEKIDMTPLSRSEQYAANIMASKGK